MREARPDSPDRMMSAAPRHSVISNLMAVLRNRHPLLLWDFAVPLLILLLGTVVFRFWGWDLGISGWFFRGYWIGKDISLFTLLYDYGTIPALALAIAGLGFAVQSFRSAKFAHWRKRGIYLALVMALGPGLIVNSLLKDHWGRPRPRNITQFDGRYAYEKPLAIDLSSPGNSFPSGHAAMGFYFFVLYFVYRGRRRSLSFLLFWLATAYGALIGLARIAQGGHFASDVLWSAGIVYLTAAFFYYLMELDRIPANPLKEVT